MVTVKASLFHLQCIIESDTCCGKNAEAAKNCNFFFQFVGIFQCSVAHSTVACAAHQAVTIKASSAVCVVGAISTP
jgi:hypothetical protein